ncbi:MAG: hypothetical protein EXS08_00210 [Planctomycetes bacterium]|nr:hypothetical protein [Planctomycetota bacterium]
MLRWLLFSPSLLAERLGRPFREPSLYLASPHSDDQEKLFTLFRLGWRASHGIPPCADAEIGWIKPEIERVTYRHAAQDSLAGRRPVLLYGSSFAACGHHPDPCFQDLLDCSDLGRSYGLLNYAVSGHGLDQSLLLLEKSVDLYADLDPVVVIAFVVESDLSRAPLTFLNRPKPRFRAQGSTFVLEPPDGLDCLAFMERHPPSIQSYFLRYLANGVGLLPLEWRRRWEGEPAAVQERRELTTFLLRQMERECNRRGLEHFVLLFHLPSAMEAQPGGIEHELHAQLEDAGLAWVDSRSDVERARVQHGCTVHELFGTSIHPNGLGTAVLYQALARGLRCERDGGSEWSPRLTGHTDDPPPAPR